ncbi:SH3 domain-containing kinase-binding protein 1 [Aplochiton taeniatus]
MPGVLSAVLHATLAPHVSSIPKPERQPAAHTALSLEQLQTELRNLREEMEHMKNQHNKEIKLLMNELDEEKKIRLSLQVDMQRMKKKMSK